MGVVETGGGRGEGDERHCGGCWNTGGKADPHAAIKSFRRDVDGRLYTHTISLRQTRGDLHLSHKHTYTHREREREIDRPVAICIPHKHTPTNRERE